MVHMNTVKDGLEESPEKSHPNNARLREIIKNAKIAGVTQSEALEIFNKGLVKPVAISGFKAWLASPEKVRFRRLGAHLLAHAEKVLTNLSSKR